jgi:hypothetical protein
LLSVPTAAPTRTPIAKAAYPAAAPIGQFYIKINYQQQSLTD